MKRYTPIKKCSTKKILRDKTGALHLKILKFKRGEICELTGRRSDTLGRFHILDVARYPRLEFHDENVLISSWYGDGAHFDWHHNFYKARDIEKRIKQLRGEDYEERLKILDAMQPKITMFRLQMIHEAFKQAIKELERS